MDRWTTILIWIALAGCIGWFVLTVRDDPPSPPTRRARHYRPPEECLRGDAWKLAGCKPGDVMHCDSLGHVICR